MNEKLFIKVNKKRGLALKMVEKDMRMLITRGLMYVEINSIIVKNIFESVNLKDSMIRGFYSNNPFNEGDMSSVKNAFDVIKRLFTSILLVFNSCIDNENSNLQRPLERLLTKDILEGRNKVKECVNKIVSIITKIKREEFSADIHYAMFAIKGVKAFTFKTIKELAMLYVQGG